MAFDHAFYAISGSDDEYDEDGVYQTDIDTSCSPQAFNSPALSKSVLS
ncbi:BnaCnng12280D [Brassica napus]|uniref:BnaCnng12280D protein n=1 Tax=Brassica napus TaxID=3708 RepID=A0A078I787_BRANA|nr:BnaCnng12280D [Brassica napus]